MSSVVVTTREARSRLSELIRMAGDGVDVIVTRNGNPVAKIITWPPPRLARVPGSWSGRVSDAADPVGADEDVGRLFE